MLKEVTMVANFATASSDMYRTVSVSPLTHAMIKDIAKRSGKKIYQVIDQLVLMEHMEYAGEDTLETDEYNRQVHKIRPSTKAIK